MRLCVGLVTLASLSSVVAGSACVRENPAFDGPSETDGLVETGEGTGTDPTTTTTTGGPETSGAPVDTGDDAVEVCDLVGGGDLSIKVPQPCGETNEALDTYEHWFKVVEAAGTSWQVQFCNDACVECEPLAAALSVAPLPAAELAGPDTCLLLSARRLGTGDDCSYQAAVIQDMTQTGEVVLMARTTDLLEVPDVPSNTGLLGFEPLLHVDDACDCAVSPDACCQGQAPTLYAYEVADQEIRVGETKQVTLGGRSYEFWAVDAFQPGECGAGLDLAWALTQL